MSDATATISVLWHLHQPSYLDPGSGELLLPWVRFHATHSYLDLASALERHPGARVTVNWTRPLLVQLQAIASGQARERVQRLLTTPAAELTPPQVSELLQLGFHVHAERIIAPQPRWRQLRALRDVHGAGGHGFSTQDLRDLQVLFPLAWMGHTARLQEPIVAELLARGRDFTESDKQALTAASDRLVRLVLPRWRALSERGQVELSTTPGEHPILPLLIDSDVARECQPEAALPPRFAWPEDAIRHVESAISTLTDALGHRPQGMWPAEGAVSTAALRTMRAAGLRWAATDEGVLWASLPEGSPRSSIYQPWTVAPDDGEAIALVFRDRDLSDRIGFVYAGHDPDEAVADLWSRIEQAARTAQDEGVSNPLVTIALDGENAWDSYIDHGWSFLDGLHARLGGTPGWTARPIVEAVERHAPRRLERPLRAGSWIESNFRIWIGHPEDNAAWGLLGRVRALVEAARPGLTTGAMEAALEHLRVAESSDWFWWYGDDFVNAELRLFDQLFRARLRAALQAAGVSVDGDLSRSLDIPIPTRLRSEGATEHPEGGPAGPVESQGGGPGWMHARDVFVHWAGARRIRPQHTQGAMFDGRLPWFELKLAEGTSTTRLRLVPAHPLTGWTLTTRLLTRSGWIEHRCVLEAGEVNTGVAWLEVAVGVVVDLQLDILAVPWSETRPELAQLELHSPAGDVWKVPEQPIPLDGEAAILP